MDKILPFIPERPEKPRNAGLTMVMDKGLSLHQAEQFMSTSGNLVDLVKLGFGTSYVTPKVEDKISFYKSSGAQCYLGGTFFEAFLRRDMLEDYLRLLDQLGLDTVEISDGSIQLHPDLKCEIIRRFSSYKRVLSEVGSKEEGILIAPGKWKQMMQDELSAGAWKVIAEARESGTVGIYRPNGKAHTALINKIMNVINPEAVIWEAPQKSQQVFWIKLLGANVNLGNIAPEEVIPLETLRLGLRGDTFFSFLPKHLGTKEITQVTLPSFANDKSINEHAGNKRSTTKANAR
jgi:phosphosulfolactate synthase